MTRTMGILPVREWIQFCAHPVRTLPGAEDCLARLKNAGYKIAVCSNWGWDLRADLRPTGLAGYVDTYVTSAQVGFRKPHPRIYRAALDANHARAENALFVGDNVRTDVLGPQNAGIRAILLASSPAENFGGERARSLVAVAQLLTAT